MAHTLLYVFHPADGQPDNKQKGSDVIKQYDKKCTAKQLAAKIIDDSVGYGLDFWSEKIFVDYRALTESERAAVDKQLDAYAARIKKIISKSLLK